jgi:hypothetical protein
LAGWVWSRVTGRPYAAGLASEHFVAELQRHARLITTEFLMTIELPGGRKLRLGEDLAGGYPPAPAASDQTPTCWRWLARVDPTPDSTRGTGTADWADLPQRLHFILDMFRCYAQSPDLFDPPFTREASRGHEEEPTPMRLAKPAYSPITPKETTK